MNNFIICKDISARCTGVINSIKLGRKYHTKNGVYGYRPQVDVQIDLPKENFIKRAQNCNANQLVQAYRTHGHKLANINPLEIQNTREKLPALEPQRYGLSAESTISTKEVFGNEVKSDKVGELVEKLQQTYCGNISYEFAHLENEAETEWFIQRIESPTTDLVTKEQLKLFTKHLLKSQVWDNFLATKFPSVKRYGGEGAESMLVFYRTLLESASAADMDHIVMGIPHRGKYNLFTGILNYEPVKLFSKLKGTPEFPPNVKAMCDIASHFSVSTDIDVNGKPVHVSVVNNPSHLEVANPVSMGKTRSKQMLYKEGDYDETLSSQRGEKILNIQAHGDAALPGQGVNQETLMLSQAPHFNVGGSLHLVVNNQIGFTTPSDRGRSTRYCTDIAKSINAPVIHVHADYPELMYKAARIAFEYQRKFRKDIFVDYNCFRKWGHNELDDPTFTSPLMYQAINSRKSIPDSFADKMVQDSVITVDEVKQTQTEYETLLQKELDKAESYVPGESYFAAQWSKMTHPPNAVETWNTGVSETMLRHIGERSVQVPDTFTLHPHLEKTFVKNRLKKLLEGRKLDWATAEAMAFGSLLMEGHNVRISGEDVGRGTFSHRHAMLVDNKTNDIHVPLNHIDAEQQGFFEVANSILSEEAVVGFEYGMSIDSPNNLIIWEAQFGDFFNGAQILFDCFVASGQTKWMRSSGLVVLLPHGFDGAASDHSSCRLERFLQLTDSKESAVDGDDVNMDVVNPTTPAQYFHLLRRQIVRDYRKPLIVVAPKILLRLGEATSDLNEFAPGTSFKPVIGDNVADPLKVRKVIFVSGKHYYLLNQERIDKRIEDVAIIRLESLCPFPVMHLNEEISKYTNARLFIWSQEEHRNMGAWSYVNPRFENLLARKLRYSGRSEAPTTAVGVSKWHKAEIEHIKTDPFN